MRVTTHNPIQAERWPRKRGPAHGRRHRCINITMRWWWGSWSSFCAFLGGGREDDEKTTSRPRPRGRDDECPRIRRLTAHAHTGSPEDEKTFCSALGVSASSPPFGIQRLGSPNSASQRPLGIQRTRDVGFFRMISDDLE